MASRRVCSWTILGLAVLSLAAAVFVADRLGRHDDASVQAGREYGASQATMYSQFSTDEPSDDQIHAWCRQGADLSAGTQIWYRGGVIQVGELDRYLFAEGCFDTYRSATLLNAR